ncbi:MAG: glycoside hydrolase family 88 protein, partial [Gemmatimonadota bacterium]|nr:glycoside hydrolase family 88 protein [Gemmatimonadota bacterium]
MKTRKWIKYTAVMITSVTVTIALVLFSGCQRKLTPLEVDSGVEYTDAIAYAWSQADKAFARLKGDYPTFSEGGGWSESDQCSWARGYYPGMVWLLYQSTGDVRFYNLTRSWLKGLAGMKEDASSFGLGQVFYPAFVIGYQITGNRQYRAAALEAAKAVSSRFNPAGFFPAFGEPGDTVLGRRLSIESMMDLELLYWAADASGNKMYSRQADTHAFFTMRRLIGDDGAILHMADFDPATGETYGERTTALAEVKEYSPKGYEPSSAWALGQAWAVYGFTTAYKYASQTMFLDAAKMAADYFIENLPDDLVPLWDFELPPDERKLKDSSAAAVAAAGLLKLARTCPTGVDKDRYYDTALKIMNSLSKNHFRRGD